MTLNVGWGWKIALMYSGFVALIMGLVIASSHQHFDLVSNDYYKDEIAYQQVLDASHNQATLAGSLQVHATSDAVVIEFPQDFAGKQIEGKVNFYSPIKKDWDRSFAITTTNNSMGIDRAGLVKTNYTIKVSYTVAGKTYYQENGLNLTK